MLDGARPVCASSACAFERAAPEPFELVPGLVHEASAAAAPLVLAALERVTGWRSSNALTGLTRLGHASAIICEM